MADTDLTSSPVAAANAASESVRALNHATLDVASVDVSDVYATLGGMTVTLLSGDPVASIAGHVTRTFAALDRRVDEGWRCRESSFMYPMSRCVAGCWVW